MKLSRGVAFPYASLHFYNRRNAMRCLECWSEIDGQVAVFTKSCHHVFCEPCSEKSFEKELSCPFCDTVLAKDGIGELVLKPDDMHVRKTSAKMFGFEPEKLCETLQMGLEFWAKQKKNESIQHVLALKNMKQRANEAEATTQKLSKALDDERLKKKSLQIEREDLKRHIAELETRYAEKSRSMRKLNELYTELRQIHKRLEVDLRGGRGSHEHDVDASKHGAIEINTRRRGDHRTPIQTSRPPNSGVRDARVNDRPVDKSERISMNPAGGPQRKDVERQRHSRIGSRADSQSFDPLYALAPNHEFNLSRQHGKRQTRRSRDSAGNEDEENDVLRRRQSRNRE